VAYLDEIPAKYQAISSAHSKKWMDARASEVKSIADKDTWELVDQATKTSSEAG